MTQVHSNMNWAQSNTGTFEEEVIYGGASGGGEYILPNKTTSNMGFITLPEEVPMIVIESNQVSAETDAPMIIVGNDVSEQMICAEEEVETEVDLSWYSSPPVAHEETVGTQPEPRKIKGEGCVAVPYLKEEVVDIPLNDESYATYHPFPCDFCSRRFKKKANLMNHMVAHQTQRPHSCNICSSRFMRKCDLVNHQKIHSYVPNRENRHDVEESMKVNHHTQGSMGKRSGKRSSKASVKQGSKEKASKASSASHGSVNYFKPTSYVDEDVKLLLEMTNRLHEKSNTSDKGGLKEQAASGTDDRPYVCNVCGRSFSRESALVSHSQIHAEDTHYECKKCGHNFFTQELLRDHYMKKHDIPYSEDTSDEREDKETEQGKYTGDERFGTFHCSLCSASFHRLDLLKQHKRIHSKKDDYSGYYRCNSSMALFSTHEKLMLHIENNANCQNHVCLLCGEHFTDLNSVEKHIQQKHRRDLPPNACHYCGKQFKDKRALQKHFWIHSTDKKFSCKKLDCPKKFHSWARLRRHMLSHNVTKVVRCEECNEMFPDRRALINHRHSHFPDSSSRKFICNECGKSFGSRSSQQIHNRIHTGERPYGCRYCWKAFADGGTLRKHERIHTGEKPYECVVCPRAFNQRVVLREHIRSHHSGSVSKPGYATPIYLCPVCGIVAADSEELAMHLVKHSDDNTVRNRNPQSGKRGYKRRRKVSTFEYEENEFEQVDYYGKKDSETESGESDKEESPKSEGSKKGGWSKKGDTYSKFTKTFEAAMKNISSLVESKPARKAKMITTKPRPGGKGGKKVSRRGGRKRGGAASGKAGGAAAAGKPRTRTLSGRAAGRKDGLNEGMNTSDESRTAGGEETERRRGSGKGSIRYEEAVAEEEEEETTTTEKSKRIRKPTAYQKKRAEERKSSEGGGEVRIKAEIKDEAAGDEGYRGGSDSYVCGICSNMFPSKADLLFHVPVHI